MAQVIIFGINDLAELALFYFQHDSDHIVVAFSVNDQYMPESGEFQKLPVVPFENIQKVYSPEDYVFFAPLTHKNMNRDRERIYKDIKEKGYKLINYISSKATVFENLLIGENCFILEDNTIQPFVEIGNDVVLWSGNHIGHHSIIKDHVFLTSQVVISGNCIIEPNCFIGVNSALKEKIVLGEGTFIAMSTSITNNTEPFSVYTGNPAKKMDMSSLRIRY
jgi:sugar O-acyltransferase (sialic acid O-acetyltransferase NeuD family)